MDVVPLVCIQIMEENKVRDEKLRDQRSDHDSLEDKVSLATQQTKTFREGLQTGRTTISSKAVYVEVEKAQLSEVMHSRKSTLKRLDESIFECKESLDRKGDADEVEACQQDIQAQQKALITVKSCLAAVGIDTDGGDGEGVPGGVFVEMANNIKEQKAQLKDTSGTRCCCRTCHAPAPASVVAPAPRHCRTLSSTAQRCCHATAQSCVGSCR